MVLKGFSPYQKDHVGTPHHLDTWRRTTCPLSPRPWNGRAKTEVGLLSTHSVQWVALRQSFEPNLCHWSTKNLQYKMSKARKTSHKVNERDKHGTTNSGSPLYRPLKSILLVKAGYIKNQSKWPHSQVSSKTRLKHWGRIMMTKSRKISHYTKSLNLMRKKRKRGKFHVAVKILDRHCAIPWCTVVCSWTPRIL